MGWFDKKSARQRNRACARIENQLRSTIEKSEKGPMVRSCGRDHPRSSHPS